MPTPARDGLNPIERWGTSIVGAGIGLFGLGVTAMSWLLWKSVPEIGYDSATLPAVVTAIGVLIALYGADIAYTAAAAIPRHEAFGGPLGTVRAAIGFIVCVGVIVATLASWKDLAEGTVVRFGLFFLGAGVCGRALWLKIREKKGEARNL